MTNDERKERNIKIAEDVIANKEKYTEDQVRYYLLFMMDLKKNMPRNICICGICANLFDYFGPCKYHKKPDIGDEKDCYYEDVFSCYCNNIEALFDEYKRLYGGDNEQPRS